ncbi:MAG: glucosaminidase domain-containing protein [Verrucomicrobiota bacterium]
MNAPKDIGPSLALAPYGKISKLPNRRWGSRQLKQTIGWITASLVGVILLSAFIIGVAINRIIEQRLEHQQYVQLVQALQSDIARLHSVNYYSTQQTLDIASHIQKIVSPLTGKRREFMSNIIPEALRLQITHSIPASATISMAIYESRYGESDLALEHHNYFGIKAFDKAWTGGVAQMPTTDSGVRRMQPFRIYDDFRSGVEGYGSFLAASDRYKAAFDHSDGVNFVRAVLDGGYCPDDNYLSRIKMIMERHNLSGLDVPLQKAAPQKVAQLQPISEATIPVQN